MSRGRLFANSGKREWFIFLFYIFAVFLLTLLPEIYELHRSGMLPNVITSNGCQYIFKGLFVILMAQPVLCFFSQHVDTTNSHHFEFTIQALSPNLNIDISLMCFEIPSNFTLRCCSTRKIQPVASWISRTTCYDIDNFTTFQLIVQRDHARHKPLIITATTLGDYTSSCAPISHFRMDAVSKIKRCRTDGQILDLTFRCKHKDLLLENFIPDGFDKFGIIGSGRP